ncbi:hypothetical protein FB567DRAFT_148987 [Paraphoma chrysanthemicola]|uniref:Uncharacterized protein n=1 Tax=Paraphoma chrysanthemicola TaxID=798071 RepID=A0A8K0QX30_9PLEO|nr:hypothetical protein FB567DRAFT_148987 [Paraphoma chrysanthemicola]
MASAMALANGHIVSLVLYHLSNMRYKERRQRGPDQPVELLTFRPTLVPPILVNKLWAEEGTSILWRRFPQLPALKSMDRERRQWYANKVEKMFIESSSEEIAGGMSYLDYLHWPRLKTLELEVDWEKDGLNLEYALRSDLDHLVIHRLQARNTERVMELVLPHLSHTCKQLQSIHLGPDAIDRHAPLHNQFFSDFIEHVPSLSEVHIMNANILGKDLLFGRLSQRSNLKSLEVDLDPGIQLLPLLQKPAQLSPLFPALRRLHIRCYPEVALALPAHLATVVELSMDIARVPEVKQETSDALVLNNTLLGIMHCSRLRSLKINVGPLALDFPSVHSLLALDGTTLVKLAEACPRLEHLTLLASEPAAIDGSIITAEQMESFCQRSPNLENLSLKFHPGTTLALEEHLLESLARHCQRIETLRLKIALRLPNLLAFGARKALDEGVANDRSTLPSLLDGVSVSMPEDGEDYVEIKAFTTHDLNSTKPTFPKLTHLAFARPQSVLSITAASYASSVLSQSSTVDLDIEEELVRCWAQALQLHFPRLDILEAWGDWTGQDNDSLNYFLPLVEPLAGTWEFLSGVEQDLWDDDPSESPAENGLHEPDVGESADFSRTSIDWERASLINEYPEVRELTDSRYLDAYEEEPEDMPTPVVDQEGWLSQTTHKLMNALSSKRSPLSPTDASV